MAETTNLANKVLEVAEQIREGNLDPLEFRLTESYQKLRKMAAEVDSKLDIDEMLNEILGLKVSKVQELARILASPELYVERVKTLPPRRLAALLATHQPVVFNQLDRTSLDESFTRIGNLLEAMTRAEPEEKIPQMSGVPNGYEIETEDSIFLEDLMEFLKSVPEDRQVLFDDLMETDDFDLFLKRFLYVVVLISRGLVHFDPETRLISKK